MRYNELFENADASLSYDELLAKFPQIKSDLSSVGEWLSSDPQTMMYKLVVEPINIVAQDAQDMLSGYDEFPEDAKRTNKIAKLLKSGAPQLPVFMEYGDVNHFVMEGRHRMVAFYMLNLPSVPVVYAIK